MGWISENADTHTVGIRLSSCNPVTVAGPLGTRDSR